jgi:hypothetical protein
MTTFLIISYFIGAALMVASGIRKKIEGVNFLSQIATAVFLALIWPIYVIIGAVAYLLFIKSP